MSCERHFFSDEAEIEGVRIRLLTWYDQHKRKMPWRTLAQELADDANKRGYSVWVSEIMLQQTQVATVIDYYNRWMAKWPDTRALSKANLDEVNRMWSGLGYYSRGRRLFESATKVETEMSGQMPKTSSDLAKNLPGVGRYTAAAIASIAFGERVGVVDGNVVRVVARLRCVGGESTGKIATDAFWANSNRLVDPNRPGDFNQALMELGATVCTPKNPSCASCPLAEVCSAFGEVRRRRDENKSRLANIKSEDIEDIKKCELCLPNYEVEQGVTNYPRKGQKTSIRVQKSVVVLISNASGEFLLFQRPKIGLLANLLEFPCFDCEKDATKSDIILRLKAEFGIVVSKTSLHSCGEVLHQFSHIKQTYVVWQVLTSCQDSVRFDPDKYQRLEWLSEAGVGESAISTAMKKVFKRRRRRGKGGGREKKQHQQLSITSFLAKVKD